MANNYVQVQYTCYRSEKEIPAFSAIQGKMVMRTTPEAFHTWSQHLRLRPEKEASVVSQISLAAQKRAHLLK
jgi:hypothetical protein